MRGEDNFLGVEHGKRRETPPRAWGRLPFGVHARSRAGNTPTCVGKTVVRRHFPSCCIETPPRAWGRPAVGHAERSGGGNTPTCVGKTKKVEQCRGLTQKHPHVRGEDCSRKRPRLHRHGNTPTCVGKTLRDYSLFLLSRQNNIETSSFSDTSCSPDNSMSWRFGSPMP